MATARISLDSPVFSGRLRTFSRRSTYERRAMLPVGRQVIADVSPVPTEKHKPQIAAKVRRATYTPNQPPARTAKSLVLKRQAVRAPMPSNVVMPRQKSKRLSIRPQIMVALAVVLFVVGIGVAIDGLLTNRHVEAQVERQSTGNAEDQSAPMVGDMPTEGEQPDVNAYGVAATLPRKISIPKLDAEARVIKLGTTASGALASPASIYDTGWYADSAKPGEPGAMLIDGHVHGPTKPGVFHGLKTLKAGDEISVERGDGKTFTYKVVKTQTYPADSMDMMGAALTPITAGKPGLNLITCTGELDKTTNHYKDRLVVFAEQL